MKNGHFYISIIGFILLNSCQKKEITIKNESFKWTINIPKNFKKVSKNNWDKVKLNGIDSFKKATNKNVDVDNIEKTLFAYKNGTFHTLESNYKIIDTTKKHIRNNKKLNIATYEFLKKVMKNTILDSLSSKEMISGMEFNTFEIILSYPNGEKLTTKSFRRLLGNKIFTINILYKDKIIGKELINSIVNSKFE
ncbi:hypothetical protein ACIVBQ_001149 [Tenacibaculum discolor]